MFSLATIQLTLPNWRDSLSLWTWAVKRAPRSDTPLTNLSLEYTDLGQFQRGAAYAQQAINLTPENADAWDNFGLALFRMGEYADAQAAFDKAVSLEPKNALYWNNLAGSLREQDKLAEAAKMLIEQALMLDPNLPSAHLNLGIVYLKADRPDLAAQALQNAINLLPPADAADAQVFLQQTQEPDRWLRMGDLMLQNQQYETAAKAFDTAAQLGASYADAAVGFTSALIGLQDWQNAAQVLQQAIEKVPEDARLYNNLGVVAREQGDIEFRAADFSTRPLSCSPNGKYRSRIWMPCPDYLSKLTGFPSFADCKSATIAATLALLSARETRGGFPSRMASAISSTSPL